jgi:ligand-binding sensor domain-containing protein/two-component sensor histidine kinase
MFVKAMAIGSHKVFLSFIIVLLMALQASGQHENIRFEQYTTAHGLSDNQTGAIIQDSRGFIWIGSSHGLNRFDGRFFKEYTTLGENGLTDLEIYALAEDADGFIWIGTQFGLNRLNPITEAIVQYHVGTGPGTIPYHWCNHLYVDKHRTLWLSTEKGIARYDKTTDSFTNFPVHLYGIEPKINKFISKIYEDSKGRFWLTTSYGIMLFDRQTAEVKGYIYEKNFKKGLAYPVMSVVEDSEGTIWAGTWNDGLLRFNEAADSFEVVNLPGVSSRKLIITDLSVVELNRIEYLLLATDAGLLCVNTRNGMAANFSAPEDKLESFCVDNQANLWITGSKGLYKLIQNSLAFKWLNLPDDFSRMMIYQIIPDISNPQEVFYLSTLKGWFRYNQNDHTIVPVKLPHDPGNLITTINKWIADSTGYWFTSMNGIGHYDPYANKLTDLTHLIGEGTTYKYSEYIFTDSFNRFWISVHRSGILLVDRQSLNTQMLFADRQEPGNILGSDFRDMVMLPGNKVYFASNYKMYETSSLDFTFKQFELPVSGGKTDIEKNCPDNLCVAPGNRLFVSSKLQIFEFSGTGFKKVFPVSGYADFQIEQMYSTDKGAMWFNTSKGIYKTDTSFRHWVHINSRLSWHEQEFVSALAFQGNGSVLFGARGKIGILTDSLLMPAPLPPRVVISRVKHGKEQVFFPDDAYPLIHLSHKQPVEFELATVNYYYEKEVRLFYQLVGWENDVYEHKGNMPVFYQQLPPGTYEFRAWQRNAEGVESQVTGIRFEIHSPFYLTWWFVLLNILFLTTAYYLFSRYKLKKALELERLRTRIATDLHDDIGATLSAISLYAETLKNQKGISQPQQTNILSKIGESSREMVSSMSDIVWAINPVNDDGEKFMNRMRSYAADLCQAKEIRLHFGAAEQMEKVRLPLEHRKNMYLIFKESLNNAVKYSGAGNIYVNLQVQGNNLVMTITDDGVGFNVETVRKGNGLKNLHARAEMIGAGLKLTSRPGEGTTIELKTKT